MLKKSSSPSSSSSLFNFSSPTMLLIIAVLLGSCVSVLATSESPSLHEGDESYFGLRSGHHHHHHHHHHHRPPPHHHVNNHHRSRRHLCQFPKSLLSFADESDILSPFDSDVAMETFMAEDEAIDRQDVESSTEDPSTIDDVRSESQQVRSEERTDTNENRGRQRNRGGGVGKGNHVTDADQYGDDVGESNQKRNKSRKHKNKQNRSRLKKNSNQNEEGDDDDDDMTHSRRKRNSAERHHKVQIRDWKGEVKRHFQSFGRSMTIDKSLISGDKDGRVTKYRCIDEVSPDDSFEDLGEGKKYSYVVEKEEFQDGQPTSKHYTCMIIISRSSEIIQFAFSSDNSPERTIEVCKSSMVLDNWLYVDKLGLAMAKQPCPLSGGFEMKVFNSVGREQLCDAYVRETRYEAGCSDQDSSHFSFTFRWPRCVPSAVPMKPVQDLNCVASWHQSSFLYIVLRSPVYTRDVESSSYLASKNKLPLTNNSRVDYDGVIERSLTVGGNERFMTYMFRLPTLQAIYADNVGRNKKFQAILYSNLVTIPGFEYQRTTYTDGIFVQMSSNQDVRTSICEDDYEACSSISPPCGTIFKITCPKTCGLCGGNLSFNGSRQATETSTPPTIETTDVPSFCNFPSFLSGNWLEVSSSLHHSNSSNHEYNSKSESLNIDREFFQRSSGVDSNHLKCIRWSRQHHSSSSSSAPSTLPFHHIMTVGRHDNGCIPRYTCLKVFPLGLRSMAVAFSKDIPWPLVTSSQLDNSSDGSIIDCESAQKTTFEFYPKENFRFYTRRGNFQTSEESPDDVVNSTLTRSLKIDVFNGLMSLFKDDDSMKMTFSDGIQCLGSLNTTSKGELQTKFSLNNCSSKQDYQIESVRTSNRLSDDQLHRKLISQKYFLSNLSPTHLKLLKSRNLKFVDVVLLPMHGENIKSLVAASRYDKTATTTNEGNNLIILTAIKNELKGFYVPYCWLARNFVLENLMRENFQTSPAFSGPIYLFSGKGCSNVLEDYIISTDSDYVQNFRFSPPSFRPSKKDMEKFPEEDFTKRSLATIEFVPKIVPTTITTEDTTINVPTTSVDTVLVTTTTTSEVFIAPVHGSVDEMPEDVRPKIKHETTWSPKSAKDFLIKIIARVILAIVDFFALMKSIF